jgi:hypothetical protein
MRRETAALRDFNPGYGRFGSKPVMLRTSKCFPVCPRLRTFSHNSFKCHWCSLRQLFANAAIADSRVGSLLLAPVSFQYGRRFTGEIFLFRTKTLS